MSFVVVVEWYLNFILVHSECFVARAFVWNSLMAVVDPTEKNELLADREVDHLEQENPSIRKMFATSVEVSAIPYDDERENRCRTMNV